MIRQLEERDCRAILDIYAYYIKNTSYTFEIEVPVFEDFKRRIMGIAENFPFFVYVQDGDVLGYAYVTEHSQRQAYRFGVNVSIYINVDYMSKGIGTMLYDKLFEDITLRGFYNAFSCITIPNEPSICMHKKYQFKEVGRFENAGYKFGKWHDILWMQKQLKVPDDCPKEPIK